MPLRDHFHPPLSDITSWEGVHGGWPMAIAEYLFERLPARYVAEPRVHLGAQWEVDVAALDREPNATAGLQWNGGAGVAAAWAPAAPTLVVETELADLDEYEVRVYDTKYRRRLVAAVELISPANKDRPESRAQFVAKCAALLRQHVSVVLVDLVTARLTNLYAELLELIGEEDPTLGTDPPPIYTASCRWRPRGVKRVLEAWNVPLSVGDRLPIMPLWLNDEFAIPLDLEPSYERTCRVLRLD